MSATYLKAPAPYDDACGGTSQSMLNAVNTLRGLHSLVEARNRLANSGEPTTETSHQASSHDYGRVKKFVSVRLSTQTVVDAYTDDIHRHAQCSLNIIATLQGELAERWATLQELIKATAP